MLTERLRIPRITGDYDRFRVGLIVVENDPVPEMEISHAAPPGVSVHVARFHLPRDMGSEYTAAGGAPHVVGSHFRTAMHTLNRIDVDAVGLCFTSSSIFNPEDFDAEFRSVALNINPRWVVVTAAEAVGQRMLDAGVKSPFVVLPPWFTEPTIRALVSYLGRLGIIPVSLEYFEAGPQWEQFPRQDRFDQGAKWAIDPHLLAQHLRSADLHGADSILVPGSGFPSVDLLHQQTLDSPLTLFSANRSLLDQLLVLNRRETYQEAQ